MTAGIWDFTIEQGATFSRVLTYRDSTAALINLTGYTARMSLRRPKESDDVVLSLTTENGGIALGGALGTITLAITATATAALELGQYFYDLEIITGATVTRVVQGYATVSREVTR